MKLRVEHDSRKEMYYIKGNDHLLIMVGVIKTGPCHDGLLETTFADSMAKYAKGGAAIKEQTKRPTQRTIAHSKARGYEVQMLLSGVPHVYEIDLVSINGHCVYFWVQYPLEIKNTVEARVKIVQNSLT